MVERWLCTTNEQKETVLTNLTLSNEHVLNAFLNMHHRQGLPVRRLKAEEFLHPDAYEAYLL